jgi:hypothetical protein
MTSVAICCAYTYRFHCIRLKLVDEGYETSNLKQSDQNPIRTRPEPTFANIFYRKSHVYDYSL